MSNKNVTNVTVLFFYPKPSDGNSVKLKGIFSNIFLLKR